VGAASIAAATAVAIGGNRALSPAAPSPAWIAGAAVLACLLVVNPIHVAALWIPAMPIIRITKVPRNSSRVCIRDRKTSSWPKMFFSRRYYLGHVDYWLVNKQVAAPFMHSVNGRWLDFYTDTPLIGSGVELERLVEEQNRWRDLRHRQR